MCCSYSHGAKLGLGNESSSSSLHSAESVSGEETPLLMSVSMIYNHFHRKCWGCNATNHSCRQPHQQTTLYALFQAPSFYYFGKEGLCTNSYLNQLIRRWTAVKVEEAVSFDEFLHITSENTPTHTAKDVALFQHYTTCLKWFTYYESDRSEKAVKEVMIPSLAQRAFLHLWSSLLLYSISASVTNAAFWRHYVSSRWEAA